MIIVLKNSLSWNNDKLIKFKDDIEEEGLFQTIAIYYSITDQVSLITFSLNVYSLLKSGSISRLMLTEQRKSAI